MEAIVVYHPDVKIWQTDRTTRATAKHPVARELLGSEGPVGTK